MDIRITDLLQHILVVLTVQLTLIEFICSFLDIYHLLKSAVAVVSHQHLIGLVLLLILKHGIVVEGLLLVLVSLQLLAFGRVVVALFFDGALFNRVVMSVHRPGALLLT